MGCRCCRSKQPEDDEDEESAIRVPKKYGGMGEYRPRTPDKNAPPKKDYGPKPPGEDIEMQDDPSKVHLYVRCENLRKGCRCLVAIYTKLQEETEWNEVGHTELSQETKFPNFGFDVGVAFRSYTVQLVRFEAYRVRHEVDVGEALKAHQFLGCAEINIMDAVKARSTGDQWCKRTLMNPRPNAPFQGKVCVWAEEDGSSKSILNFNLQAEKLRRTDFWKPRTDAFVSIQRGDPVKLIDSSEIDGYKGDVELHQVCRTEVVRRSRKPVFKRITASVQSLCECKGKQKMVFDVWDWFRIGEPRLIGTGLICYDDVYKNFVDSKPVAVDICRRKEMPSDVPFALTHLEAYDPSKDSSRLIIDGVEVVRTFSFLDFMRSGTEIVPIFAVDFSRSTGLRDAGISCGHPLHPLPGEGENDYAEAMKALGSVLQIYNSKRSFPCYGFGAKVPPTTSVCSHAFAINGDFFAPEVEGVENVLETYLNCLEVARLHGPTYLNPVLDLAAKWARPYAEVRTVNDNNIDMKYFVLVLFTDGGVQDQQLAINTLLEMTGLPISVVVIEVGDNQDQFLANMGVEVKANQALRDFGERSFITTTRYNDFRGNPRALAHRTLYKLMEDMSNYFKAIDVQPRDLSRYEDDRGNPYPRPKVESAPPDVAQEEEQRILAALGGKAKAAELDVLDAFQAGEREMEAALLRLPQFLQDRRLELLDQAQNLGYAKTIAWRVLKDGLADDSLDILVDNILHAGHGKSSTFKDAMQDIKKVKKKQSESRQTTKDASRPVSKSPTPGTHLEPLTDDQITGSHKGSKETATSKELSMHATGSMQSARSKEPSTPDSFPHPDSKELSMNISREKHSSKEVSFQGSRVTSKEVGFLNDREAYASKDPPSSAGGSNMGRTNSAEGQRSALRRQGSTKDSNYSRRSDGSVGSPVAELRVTLPGAVETVEYYESEASQQATTPMVTKCSICLERKINVEFVPCGHRLACDQCADSIGQLCPLCRTPLRGRKSI